MHLFVVGVIFIFVSSDASVISPLSNRRVSFICLKFVGAFISKFISLAVNFLLDPMLSVVFFLRCVILFFCVSERSLVMFLFSLSAGGTNIDAMILCMSLLLLVNDFVVFGASIFSVQIDLFCGSRNVKSNIFSEPVSIKKYFAFVWLIFVF